MIHSNIKYNTRYKGYDIVQDGDFQTIYKKGVCIATCVDVTTCHTVIDQAIYTNIIDFNAVVNESAFRGDT